MFTNVLPKWSTFVAKGKRVAFDIWDTTWFRFPSPESAQWHKLWFVKTRLKVNPKLRAIFFMSRPCLLRQCLSTSCLSRPCLSRPCLSRPCLSRPFLSQWCMSRPCLLRTCFLRTCLSNTCLSRLFFQFMF